MEMDRETGRGGWIERQRERQGEGDGEGDG